MNLKSEFRSVLLSGTSAQELIEVVLQFKSTGGSQREAYDQLHELWLELGFDEDESD